MSRRTSRKSNPTRGSGDMDADEAENGFDEDYIPQAADLIDNDVDALANFDVEPHINVEEADLSQHINGEGILSTGSELPIVGSSGVGRWRVAAPNPVTVRMFADAEGLDAAENRKAYESFVGARAKALNQLRAKQNQAPLSEKKAKVHWDHLLEEMEWLAKDFTRERGWKLKQCKRYAASISKSNLGIEARAINREKQEAEATRKKAAWVAKQVAVFWGKARRVAHTKVAVQVEAKKKEVLGKSLDLILGQTEKYSKMLAKNLTGDSTLAPTSTPAIAAGSSKTPVTTAVKQVRFKEEMNMVEGQSNEEHGEEEEEGEEDEEEHERQMLKRIREAENIEEVVPDSEKLPRKKYKSVSKHGGGVMVETGGIRDDEYSDGEEDSEDDERTLEEEAALTVREGPPVGDEGNELDELDAEANLSIEELMAKYGYVVPGKDDEVVLDQKIEEIVQGKAAAKSEEEEGDEEGEGEDAEAKVNEDVGEEERMDDGEVETDPGASSHMSDKEAGMVIPNNEPKRRSSRIGTVPQESKSVIDSNGSADMKTKVEAVGLNEQSGDKEDEESGKRSEEKGGSGDGDVFEAAALEAISAQPTGFTLSTTQVKTKVPFLLKFTLREYQHIGLDWLATIYERKLNGILADEMGLGKTIQAISLLAWLACEEGCWGPHLIVVPTSVMLNWEMEFKKWCPAFKLMTYYGSAKERKAKRQGWSKPNAFHICITSYTLVLQDAKMFRRKKWKYLILDEAHMIKNWKSQRWQTLLRFNSKRRLLITGTPLQNDLMELWSLMHFLMPTVFASHDQFRDWFCNPLTGMVEGSEAYNKQLVERLHGVLRPFLLRRTKAEVEKQMPAKHEHIVRCRLSKRQRLLYDEYMAATEVQETLSGGSFLGIINVLMQLRKVCNHPDLFEARPIVSAFDMPPLALHIPSLVLSGCLLPPPSPLNSVDPANHGLMLTSTNSLAVWEAREVERLQVGYSKMVNVCGVPSWAASADDACHMMRYAWELMTGGTEGGTSDLMARLGGPGGLQQAFMGSLSTFPALKVLAASLQLQNQRHVVWRTSRLRLLAEANLRRCSSDPPLYGADTLMLLRAVVPDCCKARNPDLLTVVDRDVEDSIAESAPSTSDIKAEEGTSAAASQPPFSGGLINSVGEKWRLASGRGLHIACEAYGRLHCPRLVEEVSCSYQSRAESVEDLLRGFLFYIPKARTVAPAVWCCRPDLSLVRRAASATQLVQQEWFNRSAPLRTAFVRGQLFFPDRKLIQYDCGKLQEMSFLLRRLKAGGHRCLIFTQMARMLDLLEVFLNLHAYTYMRLDGSTKPEQRQILMQRFNTDPKVFCFILSTRSGGVGINLVGADTVIFYDSDWNPAMDAQAQDRCHRIGQTREVHIYRLVSENTIEENILRKSDQKRQLDFLAIQSAGFTTDFLQKINVKDFFGGGAGSSSSGSGPSSGLSAEEIKAAFRSAEDETDAAAAAEAEKEAQNEMEEFTGEPPKGVGGGSGNNQGGAGDDGDDDDDGDDKDLEEPSAAKLSSSILPGVGGMMGEDDPEGLQLVVPEGAALQGGSTQDVLASLESSLKPVEKYAVRLIEELYPPASSALLGGAVEDINEQEWDLEEMKRRKEEQEAEAEESDEAPLVEEWDHTTATEAYREYASMVKEQIEQAEALEAEIQAAEMEAAAAAAARGAKDAGWDDDSFYRNGEEGVGVSGREWESDIGPVAGSWDERRGRSRASKMEPDLPEADEYKGLGPRRGRHGFGAPADLRHLSYQSETFSPASAFGNGGYLLQGIGFSPAPTDMAGGALSVSSGEVTGSWLDGVARGMPSLQLSLPWLSRLDLPLCRAVLRAYSKRGGQQQKQQQQQQVSQLHELPWDIIAEQSLKEVLQVSCGVIDDTLATMLLVPERCHARYARLHVSMLASQGILPEDVLSIGARERLVAATSALSDLQRKCVIDMAVTLSYGGSGRPHIDTLAHRQGANGGRMGTPQPGEEDLAGGLLQGLSDLASLHSNVTRVGQPTSQLDNVVVSLFDAEQLCRAVEALETQRNQIVTVPATMPVHADAITHPYETQVAAMPYTKLLGDLVPFQGLRQGF
ncbi:hypothetical protein CEUSTIGMA_g5122.t1 [Chlamydomonas eustigma]|uniref:Uncharacterized protein n=1 Tax=Chlamydomonas eustigma TaxID=1157962 RepID=A0A250X427_9CHLO|nr:hypothetical protein CEUSTIGMA_g5122.t1 [Chlamydomonas eustigma]|eukprot:GAX77679.1 hypothetical protein CEUSTIGMA_g5122.t1 [Chlamydomonas eustigma]